MARPDDDPEGDQTVELRVFVTTHGRSRHAEQLAYEVAKALNVRLTERVNQHDVRVYTITDKGEQAGQINLVKFDRFFNDGHGPADYTPWWETKIGKQRLREDRPEVDHETE